MDGDSSVRLRKTKAMDEPVKEERRERPADMGARPSRDGKEKEGCMKVTLKIAKKTFRVLKSSFGLIAILVIYTVLGGWMFSALEAPAEDLESININNTRNQFLNNILQAASNQGNWSGESVKLLAGFEDEMHEFFIRGRIPEKKQTWTLLGGVIYCITVYTTIGYGHIAPATDGGRIATIFYALIGIPLCLMVLADLGRLLTRLIKGLLTMIRVYYYRGHLKRLRQTKALEFIEKKLDMKDEVDTKEIESEAGEEFNFPVPLAIGILALYIFGCAAIYASFEEWTYGESVYFLFISVSTIGFGDLVPQANDQKWFLLSTLVVFIGLSLVSMIINVLIEFIAHLVKEAKQKMAEKVNQMGGVIGLDLKLGEDYDDESEHDEAPKAESEDLSSGDCATSHTTPVHT